MQARAHLKLIVSEPQDPPDEAGTDRLSMVQPVDGSRLRQQWLRQHAGVLALCCASALLLAMAGLLLAGRP
jgi:hypothetical protein